MIVLDKKTKIKLLKAIKAGVFDGNEFPELATELKNITIEVIDSSDQVDPELKNLQELKKDLHNY